MLELCPRPENGADVALSATSAPFSDGRGGERDDRGGAVGVRARSDRRAVERSWEHPVDVVAVTKGFGPEVIEAAVAAGFRSIGENYAQELAAKRDVIERLGPRVHFIGHLQSNKVRLIAVARRPVGDGRPCVDRHRDRSTVPGARVLDPGERHRRGVEVGLPAAGVAALVDHARGAGLDVAGLMTIGPTDGDIDRTTEAFVQTRTLVDELGLEVCSMGMSGDDELAVACGSTQVRLGSILFGPRPPAYLKWEQSRAQRDICSISVGGGSGARVTGACPRERGTVD